MNKILILIGGWFRRLCDWIKILFKKEVIEEQETPPFRPPGTPFEESDFDIAHAQDEFNEASSSGGPSQSAPAQEQKQDLKHAVAKPKAPAPPRR